MTRPSAWMDPTPFLDGRDGWPDRPPAVRRRSPPERPTIHQWTPVVHIGSVRRHAGLSTRSTA